MKHSSNMERITDDGGQKVHFLLATDSNLNIARKWREAVVLCIENNAGK